jgi:hypothetical protein
MVFTKHFHIANILNIANRHKPYFGHSIDDEAIIATIVYKEKFRSAA